MAAGDEGKRVLVIGAGASGITTTKCCIDEGFDVVCVERTNSIGGLWHFTPEVREGQACVAKSTIINTSKEMTAFSDFPAPDDAPNYMHNTGLMDYFYAYARNFGVDKKIRFNTEVKIVRKCEDFATTGRWRVVLLNHQDSSEREEVYDAVLVCTGHHADKHLPHFPGQETFPGKIVHSQGYKDSQGFQDKKVLVIGVGNSALDVTVELSRVAKQVYLSTRRGAWIFKRIAPDGSPMDLQIATRFMNFLGHTLPTSVYEWMGQKQFAPAMERYRLKPRHGITQAHPSVCDDLPNRIACGSVKVKADVSHIQGSTVHFTDGSSEQDVELICACTGYIYGFPFLPDHVLKVENNSCDLYQYMFPPHLACCHPSLAIIGCVQPIGSVIPISEMQARVACKAIKGEYKLPNEEAMLSDIRARRAAMQARYVSSQRHTIQVDLVPYMDELAACIGAKPDIWALIKKDTPLGLACFFGPCTPYQYRLVGPGAWTGAREAILMLKNRVDKPTDTRPLDCGKTQMPLVLRVAMWAVVIIAVLLYFL